MYLDQGGKVTAAQPDVSVVIGAYEAMPYLVECLALVTCLRAAYEFISQSAAGFRLSSFVFDAFPSVPSGRDHTSCIRRICMNNPGSIQWIGTLFTRKAAHWNTRIRFLTLSTALKCS